MSHVFLSYSRKDTEFMRRLRDDLRAEGLEVWTDETGLEPGTPSWERAIIEELERAGCMVVVLSPDAAQSEWVARELAAADELKLRIFPLLTRGASRESVPLRLKTHDRIDARRDYYSALRELVPAVCKYVGIESRTQRRQREEEERRQREEEAQRQRRRADSQVMPEGVRNATKILLRRWPIGLALGMALAAAVFGGPLAGVFGGDVPPPEEEAAEEAAGEGVVVGLVQIDLSHPFHLGEVEGAKEAARRHGFELRVTSGEGDVNKQIEAFENLVDEGVDAISVNFIDFGAFGPALKKAEEAGIPVVCLHSPAPTCATELSFDDWFAGKSVGEYAVTLLQEDECWADSSCEVANIQGLLGQGLNEARSGGFTDIMDQHDEITVVSQEPTDWQPEKAVAAMENWLVAYPELDLVYGNSDGLTVPAARTAQASGRDDIIFVSVDGSDFALAAIQDGVMRSSFLYAPEYSGYWKAWVPFRAATGEDLPDEILIKGVLVNDENVEQILELLRDEKENITEFDFELTLPELIEIYMAENGEDVPPAVRVYTSWPLQGLMAPIGDGMRNAVNLALEHYLEENPGGPGGYEVEFVFNDDSSPQTGSWDGNIEAEIALSCVDDESCLVYFGTYNSGAAEVSSPITNEAGIAQISPANTYPGLTFPCTVCEQSGEPFIFRPSGQQTYFRTNPHDVVQAKAGASWAKCLGAEKVFILDDGHLYGELVADTFETHASDIKIEVVGHESVRSIDFDVSSLMARIRDSDATLVYGGFVMDSGSVEVIREMANQGLFMQGIRFMGPDGLVDAALIEMVGGRDLIGDGNVLLTFPGLHPDQVRDANELGARFYNSFTKEYFVGPDAWDAYAYQSALIILDAIERAASKGPPTRESVLQAMRETDIDGVTGHIVFDENGDTPDPMMAGLEVRNGEIVPVEPISASMHADCWTVDN